MNATACTASDQYTARLEDAVLEWIVARQEAGVVRDCVELDGEHADKIAEVFARLESSEKHLRSFQEVAGKERVDSFRKYTTINEFGRLHAWVVEQPGKSVAHAEGSMTQNMEG